jgi:Flp pilus assembly protein TadD
MHRLRFAPFAAVALLAACSQPSPPSQGTRPNKPVYDVVASIRAAGDRESSAIDVSALRDPGVQSLQDAAQADDRAGRYTDAAAKLDQALKLAPESPDIIQDRAEIAVRLNDNATAERLSRQSWQLGPKLGSLCARNWQTVVEMRTQAGDSAAVATGKQELAKCHVAGPTRY